MNSNVAVIKMRGPTLRKSDGGISTDQCILNAGYCNAVYNYKEHCEWLETLICFNECPMMLMISKLATPKKHTQWPSISFLSKIKSGWYVVVTISECTWSKRMPMFSSKVDHLEDNFVGVFQPSIRVEPVTLPSTDYQ